MTEAHLNPCVPLVHCGARRAAPDWMVLDGSERKFARFQYGCSEAHDDAAEAVHTARADRTPRTESWLRRPRRTDRHWQSGFGSREPSTDFLSEPPEVFAYDAAAVLAIARALRPASEPYCPLDVTWPMNDSGRRNAHGTCPSWLRR